MKTSNALRNIVRASTLCLAIFIAQASTAATAGPTGKPYKQTEYYGSAQDDDGSGAHAAEAPERGKNFAVFPLLNF